MSCPPAWSRASASWQAGKGEPTTANRETHILNPAWPGLVGLCGRRVADVSPVCASAPESGPLSYRRETTAELDELRRRVPPR